MKVLVISDKENKAFWDYYDPSRLAGTDLIISCGDLDPDYLQFLVTMVSCPLLYVRGNHDGIYDKNPPCGCIGIDDRLYYYNGLRILGLGGSMRYRPGKDMYTEKEMCWRIRKLTPKIMVAGGFDILVTHAPAQGFGDHDDLPHRGFACFNDLLNRWHPSHMFFGHVHQEYGNFTSEMKHPSGTRLINACGHCTAEFDDVALANRNTGSPLYNIYLSLSHQK